MEEHGHTGMIVGAIKQEDGTYGLSRALISQSEVVRKDEIIDRLGGPLQIDKKREERYDQYQRCYQGERDKVAHE